MHRPNPALTRVDDTLSSELTGSLRRTHPALLRTVSRESAARRALRYAPLVYLVGVCFGPAVALITTGGIWWATPVAVAAGVGLATVYNALCAAAVRRCAAATRMLARILAVDHRADLLAVTGGAVTVAVIPPARRPHQFWKAA